jgi:hypothetical protein
LLLHANKVCDKVNGIAVVSHKVRKEYNETKK